MKSKSLTRKNPQSSMTEEDILETLIENVS